MKICCGTKNLMRNSLVEQQKGVTDPLRELCCSSCNTRNIERVAIAKWQSNGGLSLSFPSVSTVATYHYIAPIQGVCFPHSLTFSSPSPTLVTPPFFFLLLLMALDDTKVTVDGIESPEPKGSEDPDYSQRGQWLRAAVLGASDGLVSTASLMMGIGAVKGDLKTMVLTGVSGLVAGACSMAIGEFVSVCSQLDIEVAQRKREQMVQGGGELNRDGLPSPAQAAAASSLAFAVGAAVPLLAAGFINSHKVRLGVVAAAASVALVVFGCVGAALGRAPMGRSAVRVVVGGWMAMAATYGLVRLFGSTGL